MNTYEQKQALRRARLEAAADRARREGAAAWKRGDDMFSVIPFGQPILVGHYSEKGDRNYRRRAAAQLDKGVALDRKADQLERRAAAVGSGGVSSDDPEAVAKLKEQLAEVEAKQAKMVATNKALRKGDQAALEALGYSAAMIERLKQPDYAGRVGFADYELKNNNANARRIKARIAELERNAGRESVEREVAGGVRLVENAEENRLQLFFPGKPSAAVRAELKGAGFRWAPSVGAWQRQLNNAARWAADRVLSKIEEQ